MNPEEFTAAVLDALAVRDKKRRSRLLDPDVMAEADSTFVAAVAQLAGVGEPEGTKETAARARRSRRKNEDAAFGAA